MEERKILTTQVMEAKILVINNQGVGFKITELLDWLHNAKKEGADTIYISGFVDCDNTLEEIYLSPQYSRPETDEEYNNRLEVLAEKRAEKEQEQLLKDKELYEKLKQKFENQ